MHPLRTLTLIALASVLAVAACVGPSVDSQRRSSNGASGNNYAAVLRDWGTNELKKCLSRAGYATNPESVEITAPSNDSGLDPEALLLLPRVTGPGPAKLGILSLKNGGPRHFIFDLGAVTPNSTFDHALDAAGCPQ